MSRRRQRKAARWDRIAGVLLTVLGVALIAALAGGAWWIKTVRPVLDPETSCPTSGPTALHVVMFDRSDPVTGQQAQRIRQIMQQIKTEAPFGTRFDIYTFEGDEKNELRPIRSLCAPGRPEQANELIENPGRVRRRYDEQFSEVLDSTVDQLLVESTRASSPIIESLRGAALTSFGPVTGTPLRLTLVSDLVQHSAAASHFRAEPSFAELSATAKWASLKPMLKGVRVDVLYVLRPTAVRGAAAIQNRGHQAFWERLIAAAGGHLIRIEPI